ncbi:hypothetical protein FRB99_002368 [Tulasnella sp. 403]|nr:hypothetical protein FRB99_002368 [Tulasnella sp. 403]
MATRTRKLLVDIHTHVYLPQYVTYLRNRTSVPRILTRKTAAGVNEERLVILEDEPSGGRPVGPQYWNRDTKLEFMDKHGIDISVISSANPWLDPLPPTEAVTLAETLNSSLEDFCASAPVLTSNDATAASFSRLYGLGLLPLVSEVPIPAILSSISQIAALPHLKGVIIGTRGIGKGLDDERLDAVWEAVEREGLVVFLHPHYGVGEGKEWGERENGHVLPLALGFPMETTIAITRFILAGTFDRFPNLKILLAHSGGALPQLSSRIASCIAHDPIVANRLKHDVRYYLGKLWFDAVAYGPEELEFVSSVIGRASKSYGEHGQNQTQFPSVTGENEGWEEDSPSRQEGRPDASTSGVERPKALFEAIQAKKAGSSRMLWGTDHPFFPPIDSDRDTASTGKWRSVVENLDAINRVATWGEDEKDGVRAWNAIHLFGLGK